MRWVFTDGAFSTSRKQGGCAYAFFEDENLITCGGMSMPDKSNNAAEMTGVILALNSIRKPIDKLVIVTDSQYVIGCGIQGWNRGANKELWKIFDSEYERVKKLVPVIEFKHIHGHQAVTDFFTRGNNLVDIISRFYSVKQ